MSATAPICESLPLFVNILAKGTMIIWKIYLAIKLKQF